jgi:glucose-1-phosphatase
MCYNAVVIRAALFDIGNVILPFDFQPALARLGERSRRRESSVWGELDRLKLEYEGGQIDRGTFLARLRGDVAFTGSDEELVAIWSDVFTSNPPMDALIERLHSDGLPLFLLSNTSDIHVEAFRLHYPIFGRFGGAVYSFEEKLMKPDAGIFRRAIARFNLMPAETIYVDDLAPNVETASSLGFVAIHYDRKNHEGFERELLAHLGNPAEPRR